MNTPHFVAPSLRRSVASRAFTITELLVVITLIVILILIAVPSFSAMIYSSEESLAENQLRSAIRASRDVAVRSNGSGDGAAVFFFEPGGRLSVLPCVKVGELTDQLGPTPGELKRREVFAAAPGFTAVMLPRHWMVRGFAPANSMSGEWFDATSSPTIGAPATDRRDRQWVFPETGLFNVDAVDDGFKRSTFMIRFRAGTGELIGASSTPALVLAPRNSTANRTNLPFSDYRADKSDDPVRFVRLILAKSISSAHPVDEKQKLIGRISSDMVLARPVMQVAVYNENRMAAALGARADRDTESLYAAPPLGGGGLPDYSMYAPAYVTNSSTPITIGRISKYIEGDTNFDGVVNATDKPEAKLFSIDRYSGALRPMEVQP